MKVAVMQPYFFPYYGYFQLINAVDTFIIFDDVKYKKRSWINRNCIISSSGPQAITLQLRKASQNKDINQIDIIPDFSKLTRSIEYNYQKAPYFSDVFPVVEQILEFKNYNLGHFLANSLKSVCDYLKIEKRFEFSSNINTNVLKSESRIISICNELQCSQYINMVGGKHLYQSKAFNEYNVKLTFIRPDPIKYQQYGNEFLNNLSIIDIMMFNDINTVRNKHLTEYHLIDPV